MTDDNPFAAPRADVDSTAANPPPGSVWKGVLAGGAVDILGSSALGVVLVTAYVAMHLGADMSAENADTLAAQLQREAVRLDSPWGRIGIGSGALLSMLGGYLCAHYARERWKLAAAILGAVMVLFGWLAAADFYTIGENLGLAALTFACVLSGSWLRTVRARARQHRA